MSPAPSSWHAIALSSAIEPSTSAGLRLFDKELVVWRDNSGKAHVWEDRCPHRGMKLSFGFVRGDHLACLYHGWQYDAAGQCRLIPAHPDLEVPATIKVPVYAAREWAGIIWASEAPDEQAAEITEFQTAPLRSVYIEMGIAETVTFLSRNPFAAYQNDAPSKLSVLAENLLSIQAGEDRLLIAFQPVTESRTGLHAVLAGAADATRQKHFARAIGALRQKADSFCAPRREIA